MANEKKYTSLENLTTFKEKADELYATQESVDKKLDASKYVVDTSLSSTSANPVQNKVINEEFEAVAGAMNVLESAIDDKLDVTVASETYETKENAQVKYDEILAESKEYTDSKTIYITVINTDGVYSLSDGWTYETIKAKIDQNCEVVLVCNDKSKNITTYYRYNYIETDNNAIYFVYINIQDYFMLRAAVVYSDNSVSLKKRANRIVIQLASGTSNYKLSGGYTYDELITLIDNNTEVKLRIKFTNGSEDYYNFAGLIKYSNLDYVVPEFIMYYNNTSVKRITVHPESAYPDDNVIRNTATLVPVTRAINGHTLAANVVLDADDVGAIPVPDSASVGDLVKVSAIDSNSVPTTWETVSILDDANIPDTVARMEYVDEQLATKSESTHNHDSAYDTKGSAETALDDAKSYTDTKIDAIVGEGASETLDTIGEISTAIIENQGILDTLNQAIGNKANADHDHNTVYYTKTETDTKITEINESISGKANSSHAHAITDVTNLESTLDGKSDNGHKHTVSDITDLTATATELNYMDGVTSSVQAQLDGLADIVDGKANETHLHSLDEVVNLETALDNKAALNHTHIITTDVYSNDDVVLIEGENDTNGVIIGVSHATSGVTAGTYKSVTVNATGHVVAGTNPTTLEGYGITDAYTQEEVDAAIDNAKTVYFTYNVSTYDEVKAAYDAGKTILVVNDTKVAVLTKVDDILFTFHYIYGSTVSMCRLRSSGSWTWTDYKIIKSSGDTMTGALTLASDPTENLHAATKQYVDSKDVFVATYGETTGEELLAAYNAGRYIVVFNDSKIYQLYSYMNISGYDLFGFFCCYNGAMETLICNDGSWGNARIDALLQLSGGTMTGNLILNADPTDALGAATKQYVDAVQTNVDALQTYTDEQVAATKNTWYGTCPTAASTKTKVVTTNTGDFSLTAGNIVYVLFTNYAYSSSTLNVDGTGDIAIKTTGTTAVSTYQWAANEVVGFVYDGTYFRMLDGMIANTTYYGMTKLSSSTSSTATNLAATPSAVKSAYDLANAALPKSGGTLTGALTLNADPTSSMQAATKQYVDNLIGSILNGAS